ncbi:hypothetical protein GCM10029976_055020 [Kribbella albertanoniae]|uniref:Type I polyketide synthase n=1 Tax=Kribbella albertanoniae TaxID=1266829 RepID=A0A4R4Q685_9ACTN|nr:type I polyketide synthase [Kribbella albertanoniae]TDC30677.1 type I polyketide synthase [Kribbella albertanoniae]
MTAPDRAEAVAIVGFGLRLPGARTAEQYWSNLVGARESATRFAPADLAGSVPAELLAHPDYVPVRGAVDGVEEFAAEFFGFAPREAELTDPQQRVFLECAYEALEQAGQNPSAGDERIGVFAGSGENMYLFNHVLGHPDVVRDVGEMAMLVANEKDHLATRTANRLGLTGPAVTIQTSCSTSLVAVHFAVQSLLRGEADVMLAGGVSISLPQRSGYLYRPHDIMAPDGHCRAFSDQAAGTVPGNGAGVVVLRRLSDAVAAGQRIYAVVLGSAINNDGGRKVGYTAPSVTGQAEVIRAAHRAAGVRADSIQYVETHGTGTEVGDAIEIAALAEAFGPPVAGAPLCTIGSVKPNIGHVDAAAGVAGLIKAALAVWHGFIPPSINCETPDPELRLAENGFDVGSEGRGWPGAGPRRAGVSSFGLGGTNAHLVLEQAPPEGSRQATANRSLVVPVSAREVAGVDRLTANLTTWLSAEPDATLADVATTLQLGRQEHEYRSAVVVSNLKDLPAALAERVAVRSGSTRPVGFLFTGQGSQYPGMASGLYEQFEVFQAAIDRCAEILEPELGLDLRWLICEGSKDDPAATAELNSMQLGQPALFAVEYAMTMLLRSWGVCPDFVVGHSLGEYVAACVAGAMDLADAAVLVARRGKVMAAAESGRMLAVMASADEVQRLLPAGVTIAVDNAPRAVVAAGSVQAIAELQAVLEAGHIEFRLLPAPVAMHSAALDPLVPQFRSVAGEFSYRSLTIPLVSTRTGSELDPGAVGAEHWAEHLRRPVRFRQAVDQVLTTYRDPLLIEVGPGRVLTQLAQQVAAGRPLAVAAAFPGARDDRPAERVALEAVADAWCAGAPIDWNALWPDGRGRRIPLPTYPFDRRRYWLDSAAVASATQSAVERDPPVRRQPAEVPPTSDDSTDDGLELAIAAIWRDLLGVAEIDRRTDFFAAGGQSLLLVRMIARLRESLGVTVSLQAVAARPTLESVAALVRQLQSQQVG